MVVGQITENAEGRHFLYNFQADSSQQQRFREAWSGSELRWPARDTHLSGKYLCLSPECTRYHLKKM